MSVRGIGRRSARPPYTTLCATLLAADATWSGFGIRSMRGRYQLAGGWARRPRRGPMHGHDRRRVELAHEGFPSARRRGRGTRCRGGARPDPEEARADAQLPGDRARALLAGDHRTGAAPVHRHQQRRGAPVQPGPAVLDLCLVQAGEQPLRLRHRQRRGAPGGLRDHQAPHLRQVAAARPRQHHRASQRQGPRRSSRPCPGVPARLPDQHLRDELRVDVGERHQGPQRRGCAGRMHAQHRRGWALGPPPPGWRPDAADRYGVLRLP